MPSLLNTAPPPPPPPPVFDSNTSKVTTARIIDISNKYFISYLCCYLCWCYCRWFCLQYNSATQVNQTRHQVLHLAKLQLYCFGAGDHLAELSMTNLLTCVIEVDIIVVTFSAHHCSQCWFWQLQTCTRTHKLCVMTKVIEQIAYTSSPSAFDHTVIHTVSGTV